MHRFLALVTFIGCLISLSGCGNKGPLFLPEPPAEPQQTENSSAIPQKTP